MKNRKRKTVETTNYWQSYSDMMAALLLMFVLIMAVTLLQSLKNYESKLKDKEQQYIKEQEQQELLEKQQKQIDQLIGIKKELITELSNKVKDSQFVGTVDQETGAITFDSNVLFDSNEAKLKGSGEEFLEEFLPIYFGVIFDERFENYISEIIIEGHTDTEGDYIYNLELSQARALSVAKYCLEHNNLEENQEKRLREMLTANGKSWSNPIRNHDQSINLEKSRRVEFKFQLKDDEMIEELKKILEE